MDFVPRSSEMQYRWFLDYAGAEQQLRSCGVGRRAFRGPRQLETLFKISLMTRTQPIIDGLRLLDANQKMETR